MVSGSTATGLALLRTPTVLSLVVLLALVPLTRFFYVGQNAGTVAGSYTVEAVPRNGTLVDSTEKAFLPDLAAALPEDALVANNPWDGSAVMLAEVGRRSLFPHVNIPWSDDQRYVANNLDDAGRDPQVCRAAERLGLRYLLVANRTFWTLDARTRQYPGLRASDSDPAFELLAAKGNVKLYRLAACAAGKTVASR